MEYSIKQLGQMAGVSTRTLRYYDQIGLLKPYRASANGYRLYGPQEVALLQQILFYRELGVALEDIRAMISAPDYDKTTALRRHLAGLIARRKQLDTLIATVEKTMAAENGEINMSDKEKFEGFKQAQLDENERRYGAEICEKYGEGAVAASNEKFMGLTQEQYAEAERLSQALHDTLRRAVAEGDPGGTLAQETCRLHKAWLCHYWPSYSKEAHWGVTQMYVDDPRFAAYYDGIVPGGAVFLRDAVAIFCRDPS